MKTIYWGIRPFCLCLLLTKFIFIEVSTVIAFTSYTTTIAPTRNKVIFDTALQSKNSGDDEEWREFRARLVKNGLPSEESTSSSSASRNTDKRDTSITYAHECTPLVEVGTILLSIPTTDLCQALEQQYWHRACVLVTEAAEDIQVGNIETAPEDQLSQGDNRGRWSYRGILLNRYTDLCFDSETGEQSTGKGWNVHRGGDLLGLNSSDGHTEFTCLHKLSFEDDRVKQVSKKLVGDLSIISLDDAQMLCRESDYSPSDFYTFGGFCSWRPGQLEREMGEGRHEWLALSVDHNSILNELKQQMDDCTIVKKFSNNGKSTSNGFLESGTMMWRNFLSMIEISEEKATERIPNGQLDFYDRMNQVWAVENLLFDENEDVDSEDVADSTEKIEPGTLIRSSPLMTNDMLLYEQEFLRSTILVIEEKSDATVGLLLNHPLAAAIDCVEGKDAMPLRYGGPIDILSWKDGTYIGDDIEDDIVDIADNEDDDEDDDDEMYEDFLEYKALDEGEIDFDFDGENVDEESPFLWLHRDVALGSKGEKNGGGKRLGSSDVWLIEENDALEALQSGLLCQEDTMIFNGVCIWEKDEKLGESGGGLREQIDVLKSFEIVESNDYDDDAIESVWDILTESQCILVKETLDANIEGSISAWESCDGVTSSRSRTVMAEDRSALCDAALRAWVGINLLGDPLGTLVEVRNRRIDNANDR